MEARTETSTTHYPWPVLTEGSPAPVWTGKGFLVGDEIVPVLPYDVGSSGWTDDLTYFHEENAEGDHFIDRASRQHALEQLGKHVKEHTATILEVGSSSGFMLHEIRKNFPKAFLIGSDYVRKPLEELAKNTPDLPLIQMNLAKCPLPSNSLDAVVALNVLEHIEDDMEAVRQINRILKPGGVAVIEVPAGPSLYDVYDELLMHYRRYSRKSLAELFRKAGFEVADESHLGVFIYPAFWLVKQRNKRFITKEKVIRQEVVAKNIRNTKDKRLLKFAIQLELRLGKQLSYPFGIRNLITCIKR